MKPIIYRFTEDLHQEKTIPIFFKYQYTFKNNFKYSIPRSSREKGVHIPKIITKNSKNNEQYEKRKEEENRIEGN